jgi:hypothetical protein
VSEAGTYEYKQVPSSITEPTLCSSYWKIRSYSNVNIHILNIGNVLHLNVVLVRLLNKSVLRLRLTCIYMHMSKFITLSFRRRSLFNLHSHISTFSFCFLDMDAAAKLLTLAILTLKD